MADVPASGPFAVAYLVFSTLFGLLTWDGGPSASARSAGVLASGLARFDRGQRVQTLEVAEDVVTFELSCNDAAQQRSPLRSSPWTGTGCGWDPWPSAPRGPASWA